MNVNSIGNSAGIIWNLINTHGKMSIESVKKATKLTDFELFSAIGWLSREDKLIINDNLISLK